MKLYRNHYGSDGHCSGGFRWFATKQAALADAKQNADDLNWEFSKVAECLEFDGTRADLVRLLNQVASYPDNG